MRKLLVFILIAGMAPLLAVEKPIVKQTVTVEQLQQFLSTAGGIEDFALTKQIYDLKLTEQLSDSNLVRLEKDLPGPNAQLALSAIADESAFLSLPATEIPALPPPDPGAQTALMTKLNQYVTTTIKKLPDFYATRVTTHLKGTVDVLPHNLRDQIFPDLGNYRDQRLYPMDRTSVTVANRDEHEVLTEGKQEIAVEKTSGVTTVGEFGPILAWVQACMREGKVDWGHWESREQGLLAVIHFGCSGASVGGWLNGGAAGIVWGTGVLVGGLLETGPPPARWVLRPLGPVAVNGEIGVDPTNGSIRRLALLEKGGFPDPSSKSGIVEQWDYLVDYGPVEIGGMTYICPLKSALIERLPDAEFTKPSKRDKLDQQYGLFEPPQIEYLSDSIFEQYHLFRADTKILPDFAPAPNAGRQSPAPASSPSAPAVPPPR